MLVDVKFRHPGLQLGMVLGVIGKGKVIPERIGQGMYLCTHWSIDQLGVPIRNRWFDLELEPLKFDEQGELSDSGVCDNPQQVVDRLGLVAHPSKLFVSFVHLKKEEQDPERGWRWHKWGPYIGDQKPQCEYLYNEPEIKEVYTYHVYELEDQS